MFGIKIRRSKHRRNRRQVRKALNNSVLARKKVFKNETRYELFHKREKDKNSFKLKKLIIPTKRSLIRRMRKKIIKSLNLSPLLIKNQLKLQQVLRPRFPTIEVEKRKICLSRKLRRQNILRVTKGRGLRVKNALWTDVSKLVRCEKKKKG